MPKRICIIGGGLAGLLSAKFLKLLAPDLDIHLVERSNHFGGLLNTSSYFDNSLTSFSFEVGVHFLISSCSAEINNLLIDDYEHTQCQKFTNSLPESHFLNTTFYPDSGCPYLGSFPNFLTQQIESELLNSTSPISAINQDVSLQYFLDKNFGQLCANFIYAPIFRKLTGLTLKELSSHILGQFFPYRLILPPSNLDPYFLKLNPIHDSRIAFPSFRDSKSQIIKYYPNKGGLSTWISTLESTLSSLGVTLHSNILIEKIIFNDGWSLAVPSNNFPIDRFDHLICCIPSSSFTRLLNTDSDQLLPHNNFTATRASKKVLQANFFLNQPLLTSSFWINNYNPHFICWRINNYSSYISDLSCQYPVSIEIILDSDVTLPPASLQRIILEELLAMDLVNRKANIFNLQIWNLPNHYLSYSLDNQIVLQESLSSLQFLSQHFSYLGPLPYFANNQSTIITRAFDVASSLATK